MAFGIDCPSCGRRPVTEFRYGGEVPAVPDHVTDADARDVDRVWMRTNAEGASEERWYHELGCRRWLTLVRDTRL
jgi:heterotetrameric sarcosine oxidase delta subunit